MPYKFNPFTGNFDYYEAGSGSADLATVLTNGNTSGANDIYFDASQGLYFNNSSRVREGTIDAALGGTKGIAQICAVGYELKWEAGRLYVMDSNGLTIRWSLYNFTTAPTVNDDDTKGYYSGSRWALDDGSFYYCFDATTGAAVWTLQSNAVPTLSQVLSSNKSAGGTGITNLNSIDFDKAAAYIVDAGQLAWNDTDGTLDLGLKGGNVTLQIGQEQVLRVVNKTATNINLLEANYQAVRVTGSQGQRLKVDLALATNDLLSAETIGLVTETINNNEEGFITTSGLIRGINTTGSLQGETWADGDIVYLSPTTAGNITNIKPVAPNHLIVMGYVVYAHITQGTIFVKVDNGYELDELHNVQINGSLANNDALIYESSTQLWKNKPIPNPEGWNVIVKSANQDVIGSTATDDTELQFSVIAAGNYLLEVTLATAGDSSGDDYKFDFALSTGLMIGSGIATSRNASNVGAVTVINALNQISSNSAIVGQNGGTIPTSSGIIAATATFAFYVNSNAIFKLRFAANTGTGTARTFKGSILKYKKIN